MQIPDLTPTLLPLQISADANDIEAALKQQFLDLFMENLRAGERELNVSGMPHLGPIDLIERHVKLDGLALIRTDEPSMKYLYRAWKARNPKRGMHFLRTYLQLLWPNGWVVNQMWQDKGSPYPTGLSARSAIAAPDPHSTHYMTSRIRVLIDDDRESGFSIPSVVPALRSVVAAKFVLEIQLLKRFANVDGGGLGLSNGATVQNMAYFDSTLDVQQYANRFRFGNAMYAQNFMYSGGEAQLGESTPPSLTCDFAGTQTLDGRLTLARSTEGSRFNSSGVLESIAANMPRFDYDPATHVCKGLLIEKASTNAIKNSSMQGAVTGTPGTYPSHWAGSNTSGTGFSSSITSVGVENGIQYIDVRYFGTPNSFNTYRIVNMDDLGNLGIPSAVGVEWVSSVFLRLTAGSFAGVSSINLVYRTYKTGSLIPNSDVAGPNIKASIVAGALSGYRPSFSLSMPFGTAFFEPAIQFDTISGVPMDFTVRIGLPQCELGHVVTSPIPTTSAPVMRAADDCSTSSLGSWFNSTEGTFVINARIINAEANANRLVLSMADGANNEKMYFGKKFSSTSALEFGVYHAAAAQVILNTTPTSIANLKAAAAYDVDYFACASSGGSAPTDGLGALAVPTFINIGKLANGGADDYLNGHVGKIVYYPHRLSNAKLQALIA